MKKNQKNFLILTVISSLVFAQSVAASANQYKPDIEPAVNISEELVKFNGEELTTKDILINFDEELVRVDNINSNNSNNSRATQLVINEKLDSSTGSETVTFENTKSKPYYRVWVENNSNVRYTLVSPAGASYIEPHTSKLFYTPNPAPIRKRDVSVSSKDGSKLNGHIAIRICETLEEAIG